MKLCQAVGIHTAEVRLIPTASIDGVPPDLLRGGEYALAVDRFDRTGAGRIHMEDAG